MRFVRSSRSSQVDQAAAYIRGFEATGRFDGEERVTRYEPRFSARRPSPTDPYLAWLERRELERVPEERAQARWIHRGPMLSTHSDATAAPGHPEPLGGLTAAGD